MNYQQAKIVLRITIIFLVLVIILGISRCVRGSDEPESAPPTEQNVKQKAKESVTKAINSVTAREEQRIHSKVVSYSRHFNDLNPEQLVYARQVGIAPIRTTRDILRIEKPLIKIEDTDHLQIDNLTHSYPYLVEPAARLLNDIADEFNRRLQERGGGRYKLLATSLLRTDESVRRLKRGNVNSTSNSAHLYGTTFDISYVKFPEVALNTKRVSEGDLKALLGEVLADMRAEGRCLVKYERKQPCFHITSTGK